MSIGTIIKSSNSVRFKHGTGAHECRVWPYESFDHNLFQWLISFPEYSIVSVFQFCLVKSLYNLLRGSKFGLNYVLSLTDFG